MARSGRGAAPAPPLPGTLGGQCAFQASWSLQPAEEGTQPHQGDLGLGVAQACLRPSTSHSGVGGREGEERARHGPSGGNPLGALVPKPHPAVWVTVPGAEGGPPRTPACCELGSVTRWLMDPGQLLRLSVLVYEESPSCEDRTHQV